MDPQGRTLDAGIVAAEPPHWLVPEPAATTSAPVDRNPDQLSTADAPEDGTYRLRLHAEGSEPVHYPICIAPCEQVRRDPIVLGNPVRDLEVDVLISPPTHGDRSEPDGATRADYVDAARSAVEG